jgi:hypothetical protein
MSPICQLQMTLPGDFLWGSGATVRLMSDGELTLRECSEIRISGG